MPRLNSLVAIVCLFSLTALLAGQDKSATIIQWRGDGTGLFPKATPVTEWGRWAKSPNTHMRYQLSKPKADDQGAGATLVKSRQIMEWLTAGPFAAGDANLLDHEFIAKEDLAQPAEGEAAGDLKWQKQLFVTKDKGVEMDWVRLGSPAGKDPTAQPAKVGYAYNNLYCEQDGAVIFLMDQTGPCKIWVNGKVVHNSATPVVTMSNINYICYAAGEHWAGELPVLGESGSQKIKVDLKKGWNRVLFKGACAINLRFVETPDAQWESKNVVWATSMPSYSNAQPIMVGSKLFVMSESEDLICLDKNTGKILWKQGTYFADCLTEKEKKDNPFLKQAAELTEKLRDTVNVGERIKLRNEIKKAYKDADEKAKTEDPRYKDIRALQAQLKDAAADKRTELLNQIREALKKLDVSKEENAYFAAVVPLEEVAKDPATKESDRTAILKKIDEVLATASPRPRFDFPYHSHIWATGFTNPTPCTDGKFVCIYLGWGIAACYDLDGKRQWATLTSDLGSHGMFNNCAPVLVGDKFIIFRNVQMRAFDAKTGKIAWTTPDLRAAAHVDIWHGFGTGGNPSASMCSFKLGDTNVAYFDSAIVGTADGKVYSPMVENFGSNPRGTPVITDGALYYGVNTAVFRFALPDKASEGMRMPAQRAEKYEGGQDTYSSVLVHDGLLYSLRSLGKLWVYDAKTLGEVYTQQLDMDAYEDYDHPGVTPSLTLAGKNILAFDNQGNCIVIEPGRTFKQIARNTIDTVAKRPYLLDPNEIFQSAPICDGSRMYLRGETMLYCIGQK